MFLTSALPMLVLLGATALLQPVDSSPVTQAQSSLHIPDAIAPAVLPYLACLYAVRGLPFILGTDGRQISYEKNGDDCSKQRRRAEAAGVRLLRGKPVPEGVTANAYVENALLEMDEFVAGLPARKNASKGGHEPVVGVPLILEDEVRPAYNHYEDCLKTQVSYTPLTVETILPVFREAMTLCGGVRAASVIEAENALVKKGWDAATRAKAAQSTFAAADQAWLAMGRQFRDSLVAGTQQQKRKH